MDQDAFRATYREVNERFCILEKAILTNQCECSVAEKFCIAEREGVHCKSDEGQQNCQEIIEVLREQSRFTLHQIDSGSGRLPHGKAMRIQVGGMRGLYHILNPQQDMPQPVPDIYKLVLRIKQHFSDLQQLPFNQIVQYIAAYKIKKRSSRRNR